MRIRTKRGTLTSAELRSALETPRHVFRSDVGVAPRWIGAADSPVEEPALEKRQDLPSREGLRIGRTAVSLEHDHVVLERVVRPLEGVGELVALEDHVLGTRL